MPSNDIGSVAQLAAENEREILTEWFELLKKAGGLETGRLKEGKLQMQEAPGATARCPERGQHRPRELRL